jgi:Holliday junction resolvase RusA-like endonuclease
MAVGRPDKRKRDLDNIAGKAVLDLLVAHKVIADDALVVSLASRWCDSTAPGRIAITVTAAS